MAKQPQMPGTEVTALNNTNDDPNTIARDRERVTQAVAVAATGGEGSIAPPPPLDDGPAMRKATLGGKETKVRLSPVRRDPLSAQYGQESKLPKGTPVKEDGTVFEGSGQPYGVIGDIETPQGWLINRVIPLDSLTTEDAPGS